MLQFLLRHRRQSHLQLIQHDGQEYDAAFDHHLVVRRYAYLVEADIWMFRESRSLNEPICRYGTTGTTSRHTPSPRSSDGDTLTSHGFQFGLRRRSSSSMTAWLFGSRVSSSATGWLVSGIQFPKHRNCEEIGQGRNRVCVAG